MQSSSRLLQVVLCATCATAGTLTFENDARAERGASEKTEEGPLARRRKLAKQAVKAYTDGDLGAAARLFNLAYVEAKLPEDVFNAALVYEESGQLVLARDYYQRFLAHEDLDADDREKAQRRLDGLPPPADASSPDMVTEREEESESSSRTKRKVAGDQKTRLRPLTKVGIALSAVGVGVLASGAGLAVVAVRGAKDPGNSDQELAAIKRESLAADISLAAGGAVMLAGTVMLLVSAERHRRRKSSSALSVAPSFGGMTLMYRF